MKKTTVLLAISIASVLTACGESTEEIQARKLREQQTQIAQLQQNQLQQAQISQQQQPMQPQYAPQPQVIQQPAAAPVVVQAPHQDNTIMNMATGALIGHAITNGLNSNNNTSAPTERIIERKTVIVNNHAAPIAAPVAPTPASPAPIVAPVAARSSSFDTNKLSASSSYAPRPNVAPRSSSMNMSRLSSASKR